MATIVNNPGTTSNGNGTGFLLGIIVLLVIAVLFFLYGLPALTNSLRGPQITVPGKIDVNVHTSSK